MIITADQFQFIIANDTGSLKRYDPFGVQIGATDKFGFGGSQLRENEFRFSVDFIQMGARVYIPNIGRFLQVDPVEGGTQNDYVYPVDPINGNDFTGRWCIWCIIGGVAVVITVVVLIASAIDNHNNGDSEAAKEDLLDAAGAVYDPLDAGIGLVKIFQGDTLNGVLSLGAAIPAIGTPAKNIIKKSGLADNAGDILKTINKAASPAWNSLQNYRGAIKTNGLSGTKQKFFKWDYTHNHIEVYDSNGIHEGTLDALTGDFKNDPKPGRNIKNEL